MSSKNMNSKKKNKKKDRDDFFSKLGALLFVLAIVCVLLMPLVAIFIENNTVQLVLRIVASVCSLGFFASFIMVPNNSKENSCSTENIDPMYYREDGYHGNFK